MFKSISFSFFSIFSTIGMLIYSNHTQRDHTAKHLCLSNIGYLAKCSDAFSILIQVALEIHAPIHSLAARSWSRTSKGIFRKKSRNNKTIVLLEWWLNIRVQKSGLFSLLQLGHNSLGVKIGSNGSVEASLTETLCSEAALFSQIPDTRHRLVKQKLCKALSQCCLGWVRLPCRADLVPIYPP